ncbi:hypothetical protein TIFTF001_033823 [Ficus carica]|uniref:Uncharacterized protein n=1 Tax=Ficus carica TaxID=3494 RepID=A0AA88DYW7_FICCA|nr:hypothetical protein TIFTF001_033823 [Ficus carica]
MEKFKIHYLQVLLDRVKETSIARYIEALKNEKGEPQALHCYIDAFRMDVDSFAECMVLNAFFMIELFRRNMNRDEYGEDEGNDAFLNIRLMKPRLARDMLLFENQIPLFVLRRLFALTEEKSETDRDFVELALGFFDFNGERIPHDEIGIDRLDDTPHLLGLVYTALVPETPEPPNNRRELSESIRTAVTLENLGVMFHEAQENEAFYDIRFSEGVLSIPRLVINDNTESFFRNLVAYEHHSHHHRVVDYLHVMDCLIKSSKDVELLRQCGIIENKLWNDVKVSTMFNHICSDVSFDPNKFFYNQMFDDVNKFCKNVPWKMRIAKLRKDYLGKPSSVVSSMVAVLLLLLTIAQLIFPIF